MTSRLIALQACADDPHAGQKARVLARAHQAGLRVPEGFVLLGRGPATPEILDEIVAHLGEGRLAVRSSSSIEDSATGSGAGVFESVIGVAGREALAQAITHVQSSVEGPAAQAYLAARGVPADKVDIAVLLHEMVEGERLGVAHSDEGGYLIEERAAHEPEWADVVARHVSSSEDSALVRGLAGFSKLLGSAIDVEFVIDGDDVIFLQARPLLRARTRVDEDFAVPGSWRIDGEHNPEPLSAAQIGLVNWVGELGIGAKQVIIGGYLYYSTAVRAKGEPPIALADLPRVFAELIFPETSALLAAAEQRGDLESALAAYRTFYARYVGEVSPSLARAREALDAFLQTHLGEPLRMHGALLGGTGGVTLERDQSLWEIGRAQPPRRPELLASHLERHGMYAPAWDVMVACDEEDHARVLLAAALMAKDSWSPRDRHSDAIALADRAAHRTLARLSPETRTAFRALLPQVRAALVVAEDDDVLFYRAQRLVRRALLTTGTRWVSAGALATTDEIFDLPLALTRGTPPLDASVIARDERQRRIDAGRRAAPVAIDDGVPRRSLEPSRAVLRGHATQGAARGVAVVVRNPSIPPSALRENAVLIVPAITPALTYLLTAARALVTDHGGATSHGATLAREYGVPAVLGVGHGVATEIPDGTEVYVDGAAGRVYLL